MRLDRLLDEVDVFDRPVDSRKIEIERIAESLDDVGPNTLFGCVVGDSRDGHDFAAEAVQRGATTLLVEHELPLDVPQVRVPEVRAALAPVASAFYENPSRHMRMAGVTGTNGKTTTTHLLGEIFRLHRWNTEVLGTLSGHYTTPPAIQLQATLAEYRSRQVEAVAMEVSSAALVQRRVDGIRFGVAVFTNLTQDHLDYHKTMDRYFDAKAMLFDPGRAQNAVVNVDDPYGKKLVDRLAMPCIEFSMKDAIDLDMHSSGSDFKWHHQQIHLPLVGSYNVMNALAAANAAYAMRIPPSTIATALSKVAPVPGRLEVIDRGQPFTVVVDFAHTPDGLSNILNVARGLTTGRLIAVFGCGGDRDPDKRPQMGKIASELADHAIVTNDNPRSEDPEKIAEQIRAGASKPLDTELDRAKAIRLAFSEARGGDVVVIAGKGHEATQETNGVKVPFDDRHVSAAALDEMRGAGTPWPERPARGAVSGGDDEGVRRNEGDRVQERENLWPERPARGAVSGGDDEGVRRNEGDRVQEREKW